MNLHSIDRTAGCQTQPVITLGALNATALEDSVKAVG